VTSKKEGYHDGPAVDEVKDETWSLEQRRNIYA